MRTPTTSLVTLLVALAACAGGPAVYDETSESSDVGGDADATGTEDGSEEGIPETCGDGVHDAGEECDDGEANAASAACTPACTKNVCGDGFALDGVEECDDANAEDADGCEADCSLPACGNGIIDPGEICYDEPTIHELGIYYAVLETGDVDDDGSADLVLLDNATDQIGVLLGHGDGKFTAAPSLSAAEESNALALADLDADGDLDVLAGAGNEICFFEPCEPVPGTLRYWLNDGAGAFADPVTLAIGGTNHALVTGHFDADGRLDVAVADGEAVHVCLGSDDDPLLGVSATTMIGVGIGGLAAGDLDDDGVLDLVAPAMSQIIVLRGLGDGAFEDLESIDVPATLVDPWLSDLDGDGDPDLLGLDKLSSFAYVLANDGGVLGHAEPSWAGWGPTRVVVADLSHDAVPDFAVANFQPNLATVARGRGDATFEDLPPFEPWGGPQDVVAADFDEDGALDLALTRPGKGAISLLLADP